MGFFDRQNKYLWGCSETREGNKKSDFKKYHIDVVKKILDYFLEMKHDMHIMHSDSVSLIILKKENDIWFFCQKLDILKKMMDDLTPNDTVSHYDMIFEEFFKEKIFQDLKVLMNFKVRRFLCQAR